MISDLNRNYSLPFSMSFSEKKFRTTFLFIENLTTFVLFW